MNIMDRYSYQEIKLTKTAWHMITFRSEKCSPRSIVLERNIGIKRKLSKCLLWPKCLVKSSMKFSQKRLVVKILLTNKNKSEKCNYFIVLSRILVDKLNWLKAVHSKTHGQ